MSKLIGATWLLLLILIFSGCYSAENSASPKPSTELMITEDLCNIGIDTVSESNRTNYPCSTEKQCQLLILA